jgi:hypothetical protein
MFLTRLKVATGWVLAALLAGSVVAGWHDASAGIGRGSTLRTEQGKADAPERKKPAQTEEAKAEPEPRRSEGRTEPPGVPVEVRLVVKKRKYRLSLGGKTEAQVRKLIEESVKDAAKAPPVPAVDLVFEVKNTGRQDLQIWEEGDSVQLELQLKGPGAVSVKPLKAFDAILHGPKVKTLGPGKTYARPIKELKYGFRGESDHAYWLKPGEYTLTVSFRTAVSPAPKKAKETGRDFNLKGFGEVLLIAAPVRLQVESK